MGDMGAAWAWGGHGNDHGLNMGPIWVWMGEIVTCGMGRTWAYLDGPYMDLRWATWANATWEGCGHTLVGSIWVLDGQAVGKQASRVPNRWSCSGPVILLWFFVIYCLCVH